MSDVNQTLIKDNDDIWNLFKDNENNEDECVNPSCNSVEFIIEENIYLCSSCGTIKSKHIDNNPEWRFYGYEDNKTVNVRCNMTNNDIMVDNCLGTVIGGSNGFSTNNKFNYEMYKIRKYQLWNLITYKERSLSNVSNILSNNTNNYGLPKTILDEANFMYKQLNEKKISRGNNRNGLIAACIYMACRTNNVPRSAKEIAKMFDISPTLISKGCKKFQDIMKINIEDSGNEGYIKRFCSKLSLNDEQSFLCDYITQKIKHIDILSENAPPSIISGVIFLISLIFNLNISKKEISSVCEVSEVTINKCFKKIHEFRMQLIPDKYIEEYNVENLKINSKRGRKNKN